VVVVQAVRSSVHRAARAVDVVTVKNSSQWTSRPIRQLALRCQRA
jgi:non-canonical (house-cleaning) NTP pyrophosphatase